MANGVVLEQAQQNRDSVGGREDLHPKLQHQDPGEDTIRPWGNAATNEDRQTTIDNDK
jgi:hypothetical protein